MDNDIKKMIEKYRVDLMNFNDSHPQRHFNETPKPQQAKPQPQPEQPAAPVTMPEIDRPLWPEPEISTPPEPQMPTLPMDIPQQIPSEMPMQIPTESDILGYIQVRTYTASQATPVANADVVISKGNTILYQLKTNENGSTGVVSLPTVSKQLSQQSGNAHPYETYDIRIKAPGYFNVISKDVPVFEGVTGVQNVAMLPLPEFSENMETEYLNTEPNL